MNILRLLFLIPAIVVLTLTGCGSEEEAFVCESGATLLIGEGTNHCGVMSRYSHRNPNQDRESYFVYLDYFPYGNMEVRIDAGTPFQEGQTYQHAAGVSFYSAALGVINNGSLTIMEVDRTNKLLTIDID
jgi:hypothetical protein